jgi:hypothetical protein
MRLPTRLVCQDLEGAGNASRFSRGTCVMQTSKRVCCYPKAQCSGYQRPIGGRHPHTLFSNRVHILNRDDAGSSWRCKELPREQCTSVHSYDGACAAAQEFNEAAGRSIQSPNRARLVCEEARQWLVKEMANLKELRKGCLTVRTESVLARGCLLV